MFYGNFDGDNYARMEEALNTLEELCGPIYAADNLIGLQRAAGFREDEQFRETMNRTAETEQERSLAWRLHTLVWAAQNVAHLPGDFMECGVYKGFCSAFLTDYLSFSDSDRLMYLYDTFEGIPDDLNSENRSNEIYDQELAGDKDALFNQVEARFKAVPNVRIVRGRVPDSFAQACPDQIAFLHLDMNSTASEIAALEHVFDKIVPGGMIVFDDYGWTGYTQQRRTENAFAAERGHTILELATGQGLLIKH